jgi:hypothetical protein
MSRAGDVYPYPLKYILPSVLSIAVVLRQVCILYFFTSVVILTVFAQLTLYIICLNHCVFFVIFNPILGVWCHQQSDLIPMVLSGLSFFYGGVTMNGTPWIDVAFTQYHRRSLKKPKEDEQAVAHDVHPPLVHRARGHQSNRFSNIGSFVPFLYGLALFLRRLW